MIEWVRQCLCLPGVYESLVIGGIFLAAIIAHWIIFSVLKRWFGHTGIVPHLIKHLRIPTWLAFLTIAAIISINILGLKEKWEETFEHVVAIVIIITVGWILGALMQAGYRYIVAKYDTKELGEISKRSVVTQVHLLYRFVMFFVILITASCVLVTFPQIRSLGIGILGSAGIAGIALGVAARPILLNLMAGFQIAMTKMLKIEDAVLIEGDFARIEKIALTHVVARTWDLRRLILPISYFIDKPFQNWSAQSTELIGSVFLHLDYSTPVEVLRQKFHEILQAHELWVGDVWGMHVVDFSETTMQLRLIMTAQDAGSAFKLRADVREQLIDFLQKEHPYALPKTRYFTEETHA